MWEMNSLQTNSTSYPKKYKEQDRNKCRLEMCTYTEKNTMLQQFPNQ